MEIQLIDRNKDLVDAWKHYFGHLPNFTIHHDSYFNLQTDLIVSPTNSFGFMDGGIDQVISNYFLSEGINIQNIVQDIIRKDFEGEMLVGQCASVFTGSPTVPVLVVAPTMRIPAPITDGVDVYLAARAIFKEIKKWEDDDQHGKTKFMGISICGLGTGIGGVKPNVCAHKMFQAFERDYLTYFPSSLLSAAAVHQQII